MKLNFEKPSLIVSCSTGIEIVNEKPMHAIINVKRTIFNLEETEQKACKNSKRLQIRKGIFKDSTDCIPMTIFDNHLSKTSEAKGYQATNVRVSLFQVQRILKTKETTEITDDGKLNLISLSKRKKKKKKTLKNNSFSQSEII